MNCIRRLRRSYHEEKKPKGRIEGQVSEAKMLLAIPRVDHGMTSAECWSSTDLRDRTDPLDERNKLRVMSARRSVELTCFSD